MAPPMSNRVNVFQKTKHNSDITCRNELQFLDKEIKGNFSYQSKNFGR